MTETEIHKDADLENWYAEPSEAKGSSDCDDCPYVAMDEVERLPLIEELTALFPNEWLAFITPPEEDDLPVPVHGKLVAHSPNADEVFDAINSVLWNQYVYVFFNGGTEAMITSYGEQLTVDGQTVSQPIATHIPQPDNLEPVPANLIQLIYSALETLYSRPPQPNEAIRRLRIAKIRANHNPQSTLHPILDTTLNHLEQAEADIAAAIWHLEEEMSVFEADTFQLKDSV